MSMATTTISRPVARGQALLMAKSKRVRWECPNGQHPGVLGSTRPALDSTVRFCLPCSEEEGKLVRRVAPALERKRAASAVRTQAKQQDEVRARARRAATSVSAVVSDREEPVRIDKLLAEVWRLPTRKAEAPGWPCRRRSASGAAEPKAVGHAYYWRGPDHGHDRPRALRAGAGPGHPRGGAHDRRRLRPLRAATTTARCSSRSSARWSPTGPACRSPTPAAWTATTSTTR